MDFKKILVTGGAGTLGKAILKRATEEGWESEIVVMSRDPLKLQAIKSLFPKVHLTTHVGDICQMPDLLAAMFGCDLVIHAAAQKHIPEGEHDPFSVAEINVLGSMNVMEAAFVCGVRSVVGISTDKACHALNAYGASKLLMEKMFQARAVEGSPIEWHLVRYGNVIGSNGSVVQAWRKMEAETGIVHATDPNMTRFWLTASDAVDLILKSLTEPSGTISIPMIHGLLMADMAKYVLKPDTQVVYDGIRPGEKMHEELISVEESPFAEIVPEKRIWRIWPTSGKPLHPSIGASYASNKASGMSVEEFYEMLEQA